MVGDVIELCQLSTASSYAHTPEPTAEVPSPPRESWNFACIEQAIHLSLAAVTLIPLLCSL